MALSSSVLAALKAAVHSERLCLTKSPSISSSLVDKDTKIPGCVLEIRVQHKAPRAKEDDCSGPENTVQSKFGKGGELTDAASAAHTSVRSLWIKVYPLLIK